MGVGRQLTQTCLDSCAQAGHSSPSSDTNNQTCSIPVGCHHAFKQIYRHKILGRDLDSSITPFRHVHPHIPKDIPFPLPTCQGSRLCVHIHTIRQTYKHMWAWLESSGRLTNGTVFIFCLWHGGGNDSIIVLSAQHSLPISIQRHSSAAGYPLFWDLTRTPTHTCLHKQKDSVATVVNRSREKNAFHFSVFIALILCNLLLYDPICYCT